MAKKRTPEDKERQAAIADDLLIREVDEEMRAQKMQNWWNRFGNSVIAACVLVVLATIAYQVVTSYQRTRSEERTAIIIDAQNAAEKSQLTTALNKLEALKDDDSAAGQFAALQGAYIQYKESGKRDAFQALADSANRDEIQDVAKLQVNSPDMAKTALFYPLQMEQNIVSLMTAQKNDEAKELILALLDRKDITPEQEKRLSEYLQGLN